MSIATTPNRPGAAPSEGSLAVNLFASLAKDCRVVRLAPDDARTRSDTWKDLETLIHPCETMYPKIDRWLDEKVGPGLLAGRRTIFVGYHDGRPAVAAIAKPGETAKICHLSVSPALQGRNVGELFFAMLVMSVRHASDSLRFTLPEGLWENQRSFFESFSFTQAKPIEKEYRLFEREFLCEAPLARVWPHVVDKIAKIRRAVSISGIGWEQDIVLSIRPEHAQKILDGRKSVEIRKSFSTARAPGSCVLYASSPVQAVLGQVDIVRATKLKVHEAWSRFGTRLGCTRRELAAYADDTADVYALELANPVRFHNAVTLAAIRSWAQAPDLRPPQSHARISSGSGWESAMPVIAMLQTGRIF